MTSIVGTSRGVPDVAAIADPETGVWVYVTTACGGWCIVGGTSVASPLLAGLLNRAAYFWTTSFNALENIYGLGLAGTLGPYVTDINSGACGAAYLDLSGAYPNGTNPEWDPANIKATTGIPWSECTGWGTPKDFGNPNNAMRAKR